MRSHGFTLIELLVVMVIVGVGVSLVGPRLFEAYATVRGRVEEQRLSHIIEGIRMRSFLRQVSYAVDMEADYLQVEDREIKVRFDYLRFPKMTVTFNANGFADAEELVYSVAGEEKTLAVP